MARGDLLWTFFLTASATSCTYDSCEVCLEDAVKRSELTLEGPDGNVYKSPCRIARCEEFWDSQAIVSQLVGILASEKLGISVSYVHAEDETSGLFAVLGCSSWMHGDCKKMIEDASSARDAFNRGEKLFADPLPDAMVHMEMSVWQTRKQLFPDLNWNNIRVANVGTTGFLATPNVYVHREILEESWAAEQLALDHGRIYTTPDAVKYFDTPRQLIQRGVVAESETPNCSSEVPEVQNGMGDLAGTGWICATHSWWITPACAALGDQWLDLCVPLLDDDWGYPKVSLWTAIVRTGMLVAKLTVGYNAHYELVSNFQHRALFHWWDTDTMFRTRNPAVVFITGPGLAGSFSQKLAYSPALLASEQLQVLLQTAQVQNDHINVLLSQVAEAHALGVSNTSNLIQKVACDWLRSNAQIWSTWLPDPRTCPLGQAYDTSTSSCELCPAGTYASRGKTSGMSTCVTCPPGTACPISGDLSPKFCEPGTFAERPGSLQCERCPMSTFADLAGATACRNCSDVYLNSATTFLMATSPTDCTCSEGTYYRRSENACVPCPTGVHCQGGMGEPLQALGFYVKRAGNETLSVFRCHDDPNRCPFGPFGSCCEGRTGMSCARCLPGMISHGEGATCVECQSGDLASLIVLGGIVFPCSAIVAYMILDRADYAKQPHSLLQASILSTMFVVVLQQFSSVGRAQVPWEPPTSWILESMQIVGFDLEVVRVGCWADLSSVWAYASRLMLAASVLGSFLALHGVVVLLRYRGAFWQRTPSLLRVIGTICLLFQIALCHAALTPFECRAHPNGLHTVSSFPEVICSWRSDEWSWMAALGSFSMLLVLGWIAACIALIYQFPRQIQKNNERFMQSFSFLFIRIKPEAYWFILVVVLRNLMVPVVPTLPNVTTQIFCLLLLQLMYLCMVISWLPWRTYAGNVLDASITIGMITFLSVGGITATEVNRSAVSWLCSGMVAIIIVLNFLLMAAALFKHIRQHLSKPFSFYLCHNKAEAGAFARLLKIHLDELCAKSAVFRNQLVFLDCDHLQSLEYLFDYVATQSQNMVLLLSNELLMRPWCLGELTASYLKQPRIRMIPIYWADFICPDDDFIQNIKSVVDIASLLPHGITTEMIEDSLHWMRSLPFLRLPRALDGKVMDTLAGVLISGSFVGKVIQRELQSTGGKMEVCVVADHTNIEACATAMVLCKTVQPFLSTAPHLAPHFLLEHETLQPTTRVVIFLLSTGAFFQPFFMKATVRAAELHASMLLINADGFKFSGKVLKDFKQRAPMRFASSGLTAQPVEMSQLIQCMMKETALNLWLHEFSCSEDVLRVKAKNVADQLMNGKLKRLHHKEAPEPSDASSETASRNLRRSYIVLEETKLVQSTDDEKDVNTSEEGPQPVTLPTQSQQILAQVNLPEVSEAF
ncbi:unnamed protein product [Effrenium voratum]|nr:unnamed protein product [Effrenium voratum]